MSNITGFTTGGFYRRTQLQIIDDFIAAASGVWEEFNLGPGGIGYQLGKIVSIREREMELLLEQMVSGLSIETAQGDFLEKLLIDKGIFRKGPQKAGGFVTLAFTGLAPSDAVIDLKGIYYTNNEGKKYYRASTGVTQKVYSYIPIVRSVQGFDGLPSPFTYIEGTGYCKNQNLGTGTAYDPTFNATTQIFDWRNATSYPATGATYYVGISGYIINISDDISAETGGTGYNVGTNTIIKWSNNTTLPSNTTVNNSTNITGGADWESDAELRKRGKAAASRTFTEQKIRDICENINGVRAAYVYQVVGTDRYSNNGSWSAHATGFTNGITITRIFSGADSGDMVSGAQYNQRFSPGDGIMGMNKVTFKGRRVGFPPDLIVGLRVPSDSSYEASGVYDTYDVTPPASDWQDIEVDLQYLDLSSSETYSLDFWCAEKSGASGSAFWAANYWVLATGLAQSGNLGVGDDYSGLLYVGETVAAEDCNLIFKTQYGANAVNIDIAVKDGYSYAEIESDVDSKLDWIDGEGHMMAGINYSINQATPIYIYYSVTAYLEPNTDRASAQVRVDGEVEKYVEALKPGDNIVYSQIYKTIMQDEKIWRIDDLSIWESGGAHSSGIDISIAKQEIVVFGGSTFNQG